MSGDDESLAVGNRYLEQGRLDEAACLFNELAARSPDFVEARYALASIAETYGKIDEAIGHTRTIVALRPASAEAHHNLGRLRLMHGQALEAVSSYREAVRLAPERAIAHFDLGLALMGLQLAPEAVEAIERAISLGHDSAEAHYCLAVALMTAGNAPGAVDHFERLILRGYQPAALHFHLGVALGSLGATGDGIGHLRDAVRQDGSRADYQWHLGFALETEGALKEAVVCYAAAVVIEPSLDRYLRLGLARQQLGQLLLASEDFRRAIALAPGCAEAHYRLGYVEARQHRIADAIASCRQAIALDPGWHNRHLLLTLLLEREQQVVEHLLPAISDPPLRDMIVHLLRAPAVYHPSKYWLFHLLLNVGQLQAEGIEHFKRTVNTNYFNFVLAAIADQVERLQALIEPSGVSSVAAQHTFDDSRTRCPETWRPAECHQYKRFLMLLWTYTIAVDGLGLLSSLSEPSLGDPITVDVDGREISQDLCNSVIEANAILRHLAPPSPAPLRIAELGAGYGRLSWVLLAAVPGARITIIDIPPALHVAQWYYSRLISADRIFTYREFDAYEDVREEIERASVVFLLASQVDLLPADSFDLFVNVASLQEMTMAQVRMWYDQIDRLCSGYFYSKQYVESVNDLDEVCIRREDYPVKPHWRELFNRRCEVQTRLFESMFSLAP